jgi:hypothetical protein
MLICLAGCHHRESERRAGAVPQRVEVRQGEITLKGLNGTEVPVAVIYQFSGKYNEAETLLPSDSADHSPEVLDIPNFGLARVGVVRFWGGVTSVSEGEPFFVEKPIMIIPFVACDSGGNLTGPRDLGIIELRAAKVDHGLATFGTAVSDIVADGVLLADFTNGEFNMIAVQTLDREGNSGRFGWTLEAIINDGETVWAGKRGSE